MKRAFLATTLTLVVGSCAASDDTRPESATPPAPKPVPAEHIEPAIEKPSENVRVANQNIKPSIASARLVQDCPDPKPASSSRADEAAPARKRSRRKGGAPLVQPCTQSSVQLAFTGPVVASAKVEIKEVRLLTPEETLLGTLSTRMPSHWQGGGYVPWDGMLAPNTENKASYKLSLPDWSAVESASGKGSYDTMYMLEVDVEIDGTTSTVQSPQFERGRPQIIRT